MTLMCIERSQSPTHKGKLLQCGKAQLPRRHSSGSSPTLAKNTAKRHHSAPANQQQPSSRYKTELCRPFEESGSCKYGDKCQFAHGLKELRSLARHPKYKTELCRTFHSTGFCPYGPRCHFIHNSSQSLSFESLTSPSSTPTSAKSFDDLFVLQQGMDSSTQLFDDVFFGGNGPLTPPLDSPFRLAIFDQFLKV